MSCCNAILSAASPAPEISLAGAACFEECPLKVSTLAWPVLGQSLLGFAGSLGFALSRVVVAKSHAPTGAGAEALGATNVAWLFSELEL